MSNLASTLMLAPTLVFIGEAETQDGNRYVEQHEYIACSQARLCETVNYEDSDGKRFASKNIEYNDVLWQPNFTFVDERYDINESVVVDAGTISVSRKTPEYELNYTLEQSPDIVFDAGFHPYIQENFSALQSGETLKFRFLVTSRDKPIRFQAKVIESSAETMTVQVRINNPVLSWFVDDISLIYRTEDQALLGFNGLTNIRRNQGEGNWNAQINYQY